MASLFRLFHGILRTSCIAVSGVMRGRSSCVKFVDFGGLGRTTMAHIVVTQYIRCRVGTVAIDQCEQRQGKAMQRSLPRYQ